MDKGGKTRPNSEILMNTLIRHWGKDLPNLVLTVVGGATHPYHLIRAKQLADLKATRVTLRIPADHDVDWLPNRCPLHLEESRKGHRRSMGECSRQTRSQPVKKRAVLESGGEACRSIAFMFEVPSLKPLKVTRARACLGWSHESHFNYLGPT